jgi:dihydrofolate reductase
MRKIIAGFAISLDGYIEGPNGSIDWITIDSEINFAAEMAKYDTFLYGRVTYEQTVARKGNYSAWKNYVFSTTLTEVEKDFELVKGDIRAFIESLKKSSGKDISLFGGGSLLTSLLNMQLVDELVMMVIPVLLGSGKPMVSFLEKNVPLQLKDTRRYSNGTVRVEYEVC